MSRTPEPSNPLPNPRSGDGRFARDNPGGPGPRDVVRGAASALDQVATEASTELMKVAIDLRRAGNLEALKMVMARARIWPQRRMIETWGHEKRLRALEERRGATGKTDGLWPD